MKRLIYLCAAVLMTMSANGLLAQTKTVPGDTKTETGTVEAITASSRTVTLKMADGTYKDVYAPKEMKRFDELKIGDVITARYYDNIVLTVQKPGDKPKNASTSATTPSAGDKMGGTIARQRTITATITAIDMNIPAISYSGPNGWKYTTKVKDKNALAQVQVGDKVDITWTEAALISIETPKPTAR